MGYNSQTQARVKRPWKIHPIWRGIGCVWLILLPILSFTGAKMTVQSGILPFQADLLTPARLPFLNFSFLPFPINFNLLINWLPWPPLVGADILLTGSYIFLGFGIMSVMYAFLYRFVGPPRTVFDDPRMVNMPRRRRR